MDRGRETCSAVAEKLYSVVSVMYAARQEELSRCDRPCGG